MRYTYIITWSLSENGSKIRMKRNSILVERIIIRKKLERFYRMIVSAKISMYGSKREEAII